MFVAAIVNSYKYTEYHENCISQKYARAKMYNSINCKNRQNTISLYANQKALEAIMQKN